MKAKRILASILTLCMMLGAVGVSVFADEPAAPTYVAKIGEVQYESLTAAVTAAQEDDVIELLANYTNDGVIVPSGKDIVIDLKGFTYNVDNETVGSVGTETNGMQLLKDSTITIQNGKIISNKAQILIQNYSNLTLKNVTLDGADLIGSCPYTLSNNNGTVSVEDCVIIGSDNGFAFDICDFATYDGAHVTITNSNINGKMEMTDLNGDPMNGTLTIVSGNFMFDPTPYLQDGKIAVKSTVENYLFTVGTKNENITVPTETKPDAPVISKGDGVTLASGSETSASTKNNASGTSDVLVSATSDIKNDETIINSAKTQEKVEELKADDPSAEVSVVVKPKLEIEVKDVSVADGVKTVSVDISAKYDLVATTDPDNMDDTNTKVIEEGKELNVTKPISITIPLTDDFAEGEVVYIKHTKANGTVYIYKGTVAADKTVTFVNPNGFSEFSVSSEVPAAQIGDAYYQTLEAAVQAVKNNETIVLLKNNSEIVSVSKSIVFNVDVNGKEFTGDIKAGGSTSLTKDGNKYTFERYYDEGSSFGGGGSLINVTYTVTFDANNESSLTSVKVKKNETVARPEDPVKEGFEFAGWFTDKALEKEYDFAEKVTKNMTLYAAWTEKAEEPAKEVVFDDVKDADWFFDAVMYAVENGLMNGMSESEFAPNADLTRAMLVTILYREEGQPAVNRSIPFADIESGSYYANAVIWAQQTGIVNGMTENEFAPNNNITREQIATIIYRYAQFKGFDVTVGEDTNILSYEDAEEIAEYANEAMAYMVGSGLMKGKTESTLNPKDNATRAEIATVLQRFFETYKLESAE